jgi:hypothetical protein
MSLHTVSCEPCGAAQGAARIIGAEVRAPPPFASSTAVSAPGYKLEEERDLMRVYRLELAPGESTGVHRYILASDFRLSEMVARVDLSESPQQSHL